MNIGGLFVCIKKCSPPLENGVDRRTPKSLLIYFQLVISYFDGGSNR